MWWHSWLQAEQKFSNSCFAVNELQWHKGCIHLKVVNYYERKNLSLKQNDKPQGNTCIIKRLDCISIPAVNTLKSALRLTDSLPHYFQWKAFPKQMLKWSGNLCCLSLCYSCPAMGLSFMSVQFSEQHVNEQLFLSLQSNLEEWCEECYGFQSDSVLIFSFCYSEMFLNHIEKLLSCVQCCLLDIQLCAQNSSNKAGLQYYTDKFILYFIWL